MFVACLSWYVFERFGGTSIRATKLPPVNDTSLAPDFCSPLSDRLEPDLGLCYGLFFAHALLQLFLVLRDWRHDCLTCDFRTVFQMLCTAWLEALTAAMIVALLVMKTRCGNHFSLYELATRSFFQGPYG